MEQSAELYRPSRLCLRIGWATLGCCLMCGAAAWYRPLAYVPFSLLAIAAAALIWLGSRPAVRVLGTQFMIGERAIAWREVREINMTLSSPLLASIRLTNSRHKLLCFPADRQIIARLMHELRRHSYLATFDGVAYRDFWTWSSLRTGQDDAAAPAAPTLNAPVRMISVQDEDEVERMFQRLKSVGHLDAKTDDSANEGK